MLGTSKSISGFDPRSIPGCALWLDGADTATMNSTPTVTSWTDKSGQGYTVTGTATYSAGTMTFNGTNQAFSNTSYVFPSNAYSMFAVYSNTTAPGATSYMNVVYGSGGYPMVGVYGSSKFVSARSVVANTGALSPNVAASNVLVSATYTPSTFSPFINGSAETTLAGTTLAATGLYVGGPTNYFSGSISEILVYSATLTSTQRQSVEGYLAWKWGLQVQTPVSPVSTPLSISGCAMWLDAAQDTTAGTNPSLTTIPDFSGNGKTISRVGAGTFTLSNGFLNGKSVYYFGTTVGSNSSFNWNTTFTQFAVVKCAAGKWLTCQMSNANYGPIVYSANDNSVVYIPPSFSPADSGVAVGTSIFSTTPGGQTAWVVFCIGYTSGSTTLTNYSLNGVTRTASASTASTATQPVWPFYISGNATTGSFDTTYVAEFIHFNAALTATQRQSVEGYLMGKWGIKSSLPATHPFYSLPAFSRAFGPTDIPGCALWLDAADSSTMNSTTTVTSWTDKSGLGNTMTGTATVSGSNMTFNGSTQAFSNTTFVFPSSNYSMFAVYSNTTAPASTAYMNVVYGSGGYPMLGVYGSSKFVSARSVVANTGALSPNVAASSTVLVSATYTPSTFSPFINGSTETTLAGTTLAATGIYVGGPTNYFNGSISEILIYSSNLSTSQRQQVEGYLAAKWGLLNNLPGKTLSPMNIPGCVLWLDGADQSSTSMTLSGSSVTTWKDKSGNGRDLTASGSYPTITSNGVLFNGATPNVLSNATAFTAVNGINSFVVFNSTVASSRQRMFMYVYNGQKIGYTADTTYNSVYSSTVGGDGPVSYSANTTYLYGGNTYSSSPFISHSENGVETQYPSTYTVNASTQTLLIVGGQSTVYFTGTIKEVILYDAFITASQRQSVENYLMSKWGISNVTTHPFKSIPPSTSQPPQFQEVTPGNWTYDWQPYLQSLVAANSGATASFSSSSVGGTAPGSYSGGVLAQNGKIYCMPGGSKTIGVIDTNTNTFSEPITTNITVIYSYTGGVLAPNGKIYCIPDSATNVGVIDPVANTFTTFGTAPGGTAYNGGVLAPNGLIYCIPCSATSIGIIDPVAGTFSTSVFPTGTVTGTGAGSFAYNAGVLGPNGNIYCIPRRATNIGLINPITGKFTTFGTTPGGNAFIGGVLAPNGKIYCIPFNATSVGVIDTTTNTYTTFGSVTNNFAGGVLGPNGKIYCMPYSSPYPIGVIDPVANTFTTFGAATSSGWGATLAPNGKIYCPTGGATTIGVISFSGLNQLPSSNYCLSAWTNKF